MNEQQFIPKRRRPSGVPRAIWVAHTMQIAGLSSVLSELGE